MFAGAFGVWGLSGWFLGALKLLGLRGLSEFKTNLFRVWGGRSEFRVL